MHMSCFTRSPMLGKLMERLSQGTARVHPVEAYQDLSLGQADQPLK